MRQTSIKAFSELDNGTRRTQIYNALLDLGPSTANEILANSDNLYVASGNNNICARLGELRERGYVVEKGTRQCTITRKDVIVWEALEHPAKTETKPKKRSKKDKIIGLYRELYKSNTFIEIKEIKQLLKELGEAL